MQAQTQKKSPAAGCAPRKSIIPGQAEKRFGVGNHHRQRNPAPDEALNSRSLDHSPVITTLSSGLVIQRKCACGGSSGACQTCEKTLLLRQSSGPGALGAIPPTVQGVLLTAGRPLDRKTRNLMEQHFGQDFSGVRVHDGARAAESARTVSAQAYTVGQDIVFASGRYAPHSQSGRHLLAHELAHTVQQRGIQRSGADGVSIPLAGESQRLEQEAERAADAVSVGAAVPVFGPAAYDPLLSRQADTAVAGGTDGASAPRPARTWEPLATPIDVGQGVQITARQDEGTGVVAFRVNKFLLPATKGRMIEFYRAKVSAQALEATIGFTGRSPNAGLWQSRDYTGDLLASWLGKIGWTAANAADNWFQAGGRQAPAGTSGFTPALSSGTTCQMDHIVELQLGGTNTRNNIQVLDPTENRQSGSDIWQWVSGMARQARETLNPKPDFILLHFDDVEQQGSVPEFSACPQPGQAAKCIDVEGCAATRRVEAPATADGLDSYPVAAAGARDMLRVLPIPNPESDLTGDENRAPRQIVAGMLLNLLRRGTGNSPDNILAEFDSTNLLGNRRPTRVPIDLEQRPPSLTFAVNAENRNLTLTAPRNPAVDFVYPFLSRGHLNFTYSPENGIGATGTLTPSLPLLSRAPLQLDLNRERLRAEMRADPAVLRSPIPGLRFTEVSLGADLLPEFNPTGRVGFEIGPPGRAFLNGLLEARYDNGFVLTGDLFAHIPGTDLSQGHVEYRNRQWLGFVLVESSQIRLPGLQRGELRVDFNPDGTIRPSGTVDLLILGNPVTLRAAYEGGRLILIGDATVNVPNLQPLNVTLRHDGEHLSGSAQTGVAMGGLTGNILVRYRDGFLSGQGTATIQRGRASGTINLRISEAGELFGEGTATVRLTDNLIGTVGIVKPERGPVRVSGELRFPNPIVLFPAMERSHTLFDRTQEFPIPGLSIPVVNVGVIATLSGRLSVGYGFGPGTLNDIHVGLGFNPLEETTDLQVDAGARLIIPAHAELTLALRAGAGVSAGAARVTVGITGTGTVGLRGGFAGSIEFHLRNAIYVVEAEAAIRMRPLFRLGLDADVTAEIGAFGYTAARWQKIWNLHNFEWGADAEAGLIARLRYASNEGFTLPSADNIEWIVPRIDSGQILRDLFGSARSSERDLD